MKPVSENTSTKQNDYDLNKTYRLTDQNGRVGLLFFKPIDEKLIIAVFQYDNYVDSRPLKYQDCQKIIKFAAKSNINIEIIDNFHQ